LWTTKDNYTEVVKIVEDAMRNCGFETGFSPYGIDSEKQDLENEINKYLYHRGDVYETEDLRGKEYFKHTISVRDQQTFYIPLNKMKSTAEFYPIDEEGNELETIKCCFDGQGACSIKYRDRYRDWYSSEDFSPKILFHKGDKKTDVSSRLIESLKESVLELRHKIEEIIEQIEAKLDQFKTELETPFVPESCNYPQKLDS
jgi:MoxR-like ATPase